MIRSLVRKELRQLLPVIVGLGAFQLWGLVAAFVLTAADTYDWATSSWLTAPLGPKIVGYSELLVGIVIAYGLLPGEHDQRTIEFLYTLPVRRRTLFLVKYAVGCGVLMVLDLTGTLQAVLRHACNPGSFERAFLRPRPIALHVLAGLVLPFVFVAYGMLLSFFRRLGWMLAALIWLALELAARSRPQLSVLDVTALFRVEHRGTEALVSWRAWWIHGAMAALALLVAANLWLTQQESFAAFYEKLANSLKLRRLAMGLAGAVAVLLMMGIVVAVSSPPPAPAAPAAPAARPMTVETAKLHFTYAPARATQAMVIVRAADEAYARVRDWLSAPEVSPIVADLTDESDEHGGIAGWKKLRIDVRPPKTDARLVHVLYHELTHVFSAALSEGAPTERQADAQFFTEGLAEYVSFALLGDAIVEREEGEEGRRVAALAWRQFHLQFDDLLDPRAFAARHDEYLLYPLGELWVASLVDTCGREAPARLLRRFGRADTPQTLAGHELWRHSLQLDRCDLDRVVGGFEQKLRRLEPGRGTVPLASAVVVGRGAGDTLVFDVTVEAPTAGPFLVVVRVRTDSQAARDEVRTNTVSVASGVTRSIAVALPERPSERVEFQVGARGRPAGPIFFTRWQSTPRP